jgi:hypothetical protein
MEHVSQLVASQDGRLLRCGVALAVISTHAVCHAAKLNPIILSGDGTAVQHIFVKPPKGGTPGNAAAGNAFLHA